MLRLRIAMPRLLTLFLSSIAGFSLTPALSADAAKDKRRPSDFGIICQMGYAGDHFPTEPEAFEKLLLSVKSAHYNTILCRHTPWREALCKKHGIKIMVDLLAGDHHVYKSPAGAEKLCTSLRNSESIYAYHLWSDRMGGTVKGRNRDLANVQKWDPNHATYVGDYNAKEISGLSNPDLVGYYDFHWKRGGHWRHLLRAREVARKTDSYFLKYADGAPGKVGVGNYNRVLYTISMSVACGLKGYTFHHTGSEIDKSTWEWKPLGEDLSRVNAMIAPLGPELMKLGNPVALYSTPITMTAKNRPTGTDPAVPAEFKSVPADSTLKVLAGEAVIGVYQDPKGREALLLANHNSYEPQMMELQFEKKVVGVAMFDRREKTWKRLPLREGTVSFEIPPAAVELLLLKQ
jgi:hypothetical protein